MRKLFKKMILIIVAAFAILLIGLIINNRVINIKYNNIDTKSNNLSEEDIRRVHQVYNYLTEEGNRIFTGFDGKDMSLLIYNEAYEFLFSDFQPSGQEWDYIGEDEYLVKHIHRRMAKNSQAFAVKLGSTWVGSFATKDTYQKLMLREIPIFYPPQLISVDEQYYKAIVIHEMAHAFQGKCNSIRINQAQHIQNVGITYEKDRRFNTLIEQEAKYLETAMQSDDIDTVRNSVQLFLQARVQRRNECQMTAKEIAEEQEFEWLEGLARYAEYKVSRGSSSPIAKGLSNISEKVKVKSDDRYYTLGMAEYMIIQKLDPRYEQDILHSQIILVDILSELCLSKE